MNNRNENLKKKTPLAFSNGICCQNENVYDDKDSKEHVGIMIKKNGLLNYSIIKLDD